MKTAGGRHAGCQRPDGVDVRRCRGRHRFRVQCTLRRGPGSRPRHASRGWRWGILSFVRHAVFHRADAARIGWTAERTNPFQIEVGLANLAWGLFAVLAVALSWGLAAEAAGFIVFGLYMGSVAIFEVVISRGHNARPWAQVIPSVAFAVLLLVIGVQGMNAAG